MDDIERAQQHEAMDRAIAVKAHAERPKRVATTVTAADGTTTYHCDECDEELIPFRVQFGLCIDCATEAETRARLYRKP